MKELKITQKEAGQRFDKFLKKYLSEAPGSFIYKMLRKKNITLNGRKAAGNEILAGGDLVKLFLSDETIDKFHVETAAPTGAIPDKLPAPEIVYEDDDLIFLNKPANLLTQHGNSKEASLTEYLLSDLTARKALSDEDLRAFRPSPANRLDRNTSGLVLCSKSLQGAQFLSEIIRDRNLRKEYRVLVKGQVTESGIHTVYYTKDSAQNRVTLFSTKAEGRGTMITGITPVQVSTDASLLTVELITGKTHQIRAHLSHLGHPVLGDPKYGDPVINRQLKSRCGVRRQMLHAWKITFPVLTGRFAYLSQTSFTAEVPEDFRRAAKSLHFA